ncbi:transposase family protein [Brevibacillus centrosporus]|uniref:Mu transposase C-terminal domain-containing protein n=1 Tax=Brevibacillus centrosporus TaxID=54910 RepID=UPI000F0A5F8C|nr:Mu transposase C-terminal domain-containing protein [Brevibacillus centrosporus]MEC2133407.1 transposase family protein [Brevibacillus centrosporus]RNB67766.1 hypothetical protein EDM55_19095 [Brevibacillus centrosporus]GED34126.1 hypothetical protein BCE02nite_52670 [Brevibacillus centrosporus]
MEIIRPLVVLDDIKSGDVRAVYEFMEYHRELLLENETVYDITQKDIVDRISKKVGISGRTIKRYLSSYRAAEREMEQKGEEGLVTKAGTGYIHRKDNKALEICHPKDPQWVLDVLQVRLDEKYISIIKAIIEQEYLTTKKPSITAIYRSIEIKCAKEEIDPPPYITINKLINRIDPKIKERMQEGKKASQKYDPVLRGFSNEEALYPLHIVEIDHTQLDVDVIDDKSGLVIGRPWITLGIDVFSRMVWCMYISFEPPSANVVRKAIQHGILFKNVKAKYGLINEWNVFGIPKIFHLDNGPDFKSTAVKRMINETLKANVRYRPVRTPRYGGTIERLFGTLNTSIIHGWDGTRKSNVTQLGEYNPEEDAKLTLGNVIELLTRYITDEYHMDVHRGLPLDANRPITRYIDGLKQVGYPDFIDDSEEETLKIELLPTIIKRYTRDGIRLNNVFYKSDKLSNLISTTKRYKVKYDIDDISKIYIQLPDSTEYEEVLAVQPSAEQLENVNLYTYKKIREILGEEAELKSKRVPGTQMIMEAKMRLRERTEELYKKGRKARAAAMRMNFEVNLTSPKETKEGKHVPMESDLIAFIRYQEQKREAGK